MLPEVIEDGTLLICSHGTKPSRIQTNRRTAQGQLDVPRASDYTVGHLGSFGHCQSLRNPATAGATAASLGVLTPAVCTPTVLTPWSTGQAPGTAADQPAKETLGPDSRCECCWGGVISFAEEKAPPNPFEGLEPHQAAVLRDHILVMQEFEETTGLSYNRMSTASNDGEQVASRILYEIIARRNQDKLRALVRRLGH